jgi:hypothetical protein
LANVELVASAWFVFMAIEVRGDTPSVWHVVGHLVVAAGWIGLYTRTACAVALDVDTFEVLLPVGRRVYAVADVAGIHLRPVWAATTTTLLKVTLRGSRRARRFYLFTTGAQQQRLLTEMRAVVDAYVEVGLLGAREPQTGPR